MDFNSSVRTVMHRKVINRTLNALSCPQTPNMFHHQVCIKGIWMIIIEQTTLFICQFIMSFVIVVVINDCHFIPKAFFQAIGQSCFPAACTACNANYHHFFRCHGMLLSQPQLSPVPKIIRISTPVGSSSGAVSTAALAK